jgi:hypothetical protein
MEVRTPHAERLKTSPDAGSAHERLKLWGDFGLIQRKVHRQRRRRRRRGA